MRVGLKFWDTFVIARSKVNFKVKCQFQGKYDISTNLARNKCNIHVILTGQSISENILFIFQGHLQVKSISGSSKRKCHF